MRIVAGKDTTLRLYNTDADGTPVNFVGDVDVVVTDGAGAQLETGQATEVDGATGAYEFPLPAQSVLDRLVVVWSSGAESITEFVDVVGARLVDLRTLREQHGLSNLEGERLRELVDEVEETFAEILGFPVVPQSLRTTLDASAVGGRLLIPGLLFPAEIYTVDLDDEALTVADLRGVSGWLEWVDGRNWSGGHYSIHLAHGWTSVPRDVREAAVKYVLYRSRKPDSKIPDRATRVVTQEADFTLAQPDHDHPTGLPDVDAVLLRHRIELPV